ncbi:hypothetical protein CRYUN_Cryun04dG0076300 [Craigia yunnanensis]
MIASIVFERCLILLISITSSPDSVFSASPLHLFLGWKERDEREREFLPMSLYSLELYIPQVLRRRSFSKNLQRIIAFLF